MSMSPQDRVRQSVAHKVAPDVILARYRAMKGVADAKFEDISPSAMAVLIGEVMEFLSPSSLVESIKRCNLVQAHQLASAEDEQATVMAQARKDTVRFGRCHICGDPVLTNAAELMLSDSFKARVHGLCAAKDEHHYEFISEFLYRVRPVNGGDVDPRD